MTTATVVEPEEGSEDPVAKYDFDEAFQLQVAALCMRDLGFARRTDGLVKPEYFENAALGFLTELSLGYYNTYGTTPTNVVVDVLIADEFKRNPRLKSELMGDVVESIFDIRAADLTAADYIAERIAPFAQYQALSDGLLDSVEVMEQAMAEGDAELFQSVRTKIEKASQVGLNDDLSGIDYFVDVEKRTAIRQAKERGEIKPIGITTGVKPLDAMLYHSGWGKKELTLLMGGPKVGKSTALAEFAKSAALDGKNVLIVTLEVSSDIYADRMDANMASVEMFGLIEESKRVESRVIDMGKRSGMIKIHEYATGSMTPNALNRLISRYKSSGTRFDMVVLDYADLMRANEPVDSAIENSKSIYTELRATAQRENVALLTATQLNRAGATAVVAGGEHVAEDYNRIRIADLAISINRNEDDKKENKARLYFAASRNQADAFTVTVEQQMDKMRFIHKLVDIA